MTRMSIPDSHLEWDWSALPLLKYEIDDMRLLYENDIRFLKQF